jgi:hypothetical protein
VLFVYVHGAIPERLAQAVAALRPGAPVDPAEVVAVGWDGVRAKVGAFVAQGFSKFVVVPAVEPASWGDEIETLAREVLPLQT